MIPHDTDFLEASIFSQIRISLFCADGKPTAECLDAGVCVGYLIFAHRRHICKVSTISDKRIG